MNDFSIGLWHTMKSGFYMTTGDNQLRGWTKKLQSTSQNQTCTKKRSWSLLDGLLPVWPTTAFWIPEKPLHLRYMFSKSMRCTENCKGCSQHWSREGPNSPQQHLTTQCTANASKVQRIRLWSFCSSTIFTSPLATNYHFLKHLNNFLQGKHFHNQ